VHGLGLVEALLRLGHVLGADAALGEVDVALLLVDADDHDDLVLADADELVDAADAAAAQLAQQDQALDVVVLEQLHVGAHLRDVLHVHHD